MLYQNPEMGSIAPVYVSSGQLEEMYAGGGELSENILIHLKQSVLKLVIFSWFYGNICTLCIL